MGKPLAVPPAAPVKQAAPTQQAAPAAQTAPAQQAKPTQQAQTDQFVPAAKGKGHFQAPALTATPAAPAAPTAATLTARIDDAATRLVATLRNDLNGLSIMEQCTTNVSNAFMDLKNLCVDIFGRGSSSTGGSAPVPVTPSAGETAAPTLPTGTEPPAPA
jgi:hypothetical protein